MPRQDAYAAERFRNTATILLRYEPPAATVRSLCATGRCSPTTRGQSATTSPVAWRRRIRDRRSHKQTARPPPKLGAAEQIVTAARWLDEQRFGSTCGVVWTPQFGDIRRPWKTTQRAGIAFLSSNLERLDAGEIQPAEAAPLVTDARRRVRAPEGVADRPVGRFQGYARAVTNGWSRRRLEGVKARIRRPLSRQNGRAERTCLAPELLASLADVPEALPWWGRRHLHPWVCRQRHTPSVTRSSGRLGWRTGRWCSCRSTLTPPRRQESHGAPCARSATPHTSAHAVMRTFFELDLSRPTAPRARPAGS